jgi:hypothetical protein
MVFWEKSPKLKTKPIPMKCPPLNKILFLLLLLSACRERAVDVPLPFEGEKLVLWGRLEAGQPVRIQVSKTFAPEGEVPAATYVNTASLALFKNGSPLSNLRLLDDKGLYGSEVLIEAGATYIVRAEAPGLPTASSEEVLIPAEVPKFTFTRTKNVPPHYASQGKFDLINLHITNDEKYFLMINISAKFKEYDFPFFQPSRSNFGFKEDNCYTSSAAGTAKPYYFINPLCQPPSSPLGFYVQTQMGMSLPNMPMEVVDASSVSIELVAISKTWFDYTALESKQPEGLDHMVLPPQKAFTNIHNGYGLIYGSNSLKTALL